MLLGGTRARQAQIYPVKLCRAIVQGLRDQVISDAREGLRIIGSCDLSGRLPQSEEKLDMALSGCTSYPGYAGNGCGLDILRMEEDSCPSGDGGIACSGEDDIDGDHGDMDGWIALDDVKGGPCPHRW